MSDEQFEVLVAEALDSLPEEFQNKLNNVDVVIEDYPTPWQIRKMRMREGTILFGLYEGVPQTRRGSGYSLTMPDKITIFKQAIEDYYQDPQIVREQVRKTVLHEIGHHFGMNDKELRKLKY